MSGDKIHVKVDYYIPTATTNNSIANGLNTIINGLAFLIDNSKLTTAMHGSGNTITTNLENSIPFTDFFAPQNDSAGTTMPKAYLNIVFFDEQFKFVSENSEAIQVTTEGSGQTIYRLDGNAKEAAKNGYVYIYVNNESDNLVYFDNLQITDERGPLLEESHYYPFGTEMAGISSRSLPSYVPNRYKANAGAEYGDEEWSNGGGLEMYETFYRSYNAQIGRFMQGDPKMEVSMESYAFAGNNPILFNDPFGDLSQAAWDDVLSRLGNGRNLDGFGEYGGYYSEGGGGGGGGFTPFSSDAEAFGWGASQMDANGWWGSQSGWAGSFNEAYQNFSAGSSSDGQKGYNYATADFSSIYFYKNKYHGDVEYFSGPTGGANYYFSGYGNVDDFKAIQEGYKLQQEASWYEWDGPMFRALTPDFVSVGVGFNGIAGIGAGTSIEFNWVLHGPEASWKPALTATQSIGVGYSIDATINVGTARYSGNARKISRQMLVTNSLGGRNAPTMWGSASITEIGKIGVTGSFTYLGSQEFIYGSQLNVGAGLPAGIMPVNGAIGLSNTWILYDFYKK